MKLLPTQVEQSGPGIDLSDLPDGLSVEMSDSVEDFAYSRNAVTLVYDLSDYDSVRLTFAAKEYGDEPHEPPPAPFGDDANFDGVAVSTDGVDWYEVQGLRGLRSDRFTDFDLDVDAAVAGLGLSYGPEFRIRFCQYDNNPGPMDGIFVRRIELTGELRSTILHLPMDDNAANPAVTDASGNAHHQTLLDPGGDPNTAAHSAPGVVANALYFDGVDDRISLTPESYSQALQQNQDFSIAFWWKTDSPDPGGWAYILCNSAADESYLLASTVNGDFRISVCFVTDETRWTGQLWTGGADDSWHHYVLTRAGTVLSFYRDGGLEKAVDHPENTLSLASSQNLTVGSYPGGGDPAPGWMDEFRIYDRALSATEVFSVFMIGR